MWTAFCFFLMLCCNVERCFCYFYMSKLHTGGVWCAQKLKYFVFLNCHLVIVS